MLTEAREANNNEKYVCSQIKAKTPPPLPNKFAQLFDCLNQPTNIDFYMILLINLMPYLVEKASVIVMNIAFYYTFLGELVWNIMVNQNSLQKMRPRLRLQILKFWFFFT